MRKYINLIVLVLFLLPMPIYAWTPDTCICGPGDGVSGGSPSDNLSTTGQNRVDLWKAFRWKAGKSGEAYIFAAMVADLQNPGASNDLTFGVYDDDISNPSNPKPGNLMVSGHILNYDVTQIGVGRHYWDLTTVHTTRAIIAGHYYWLTIRIETSNANRLWWARQGSDPLPNWCYKMMSQTDYGGDYTQGPPAGSSYSDYYAPNYYGWSIWDAVGEGDSITVPSGLEIVNP